MKKSIIRLTLLTIAVMAPQVNSTGLSSSQNGSEDIRTRNICGPLALAISTSYLGKPELFDRIFELLPPDGEPRTLNELKATADELGLSTRAVRWRPGRDLNFSCPAIVRLDPTSTAGIGHFIVVLRTSGDAVQVLDMPHAPTWVQKKKLWDLWDGIALHVAASGSDLPREAGPSTHTMVSTLAFSAGALTLLALAVPLRTMRAKNLSPEYASGPRRRPRRFVLIAVILAAMISPTLARWGADARSPIDQPAFEVFPPFQPLTINASTLAAGTPERVTTSYRIYNRTERPASIGRVSTSCGCASPEPSAHQIPAGGSIEFRVDVEPMREQTRYYTIDVLFDQPENYHIEMSGSITVLPDTDALPAGSR